MVIEKDVPVSEQQTMFDDPRALDALCHHPGSCYWHRFQRFHHAHPEVFVWLVDNTREFQRQGHRKTGVEYLVNTLRWRALALPGIRAMMQLPDINEDYAINQNYSAYYARLIMQQHPSLDEMFNRKRSHADFHL